MSIVRKRVVKELERGKGSAGNWAMMIVSTNEALTERGRKKSDAREDEQREESKVFA
jgi:hypothetical protein